MTDRAGFKSAALVFTFNLSPLFFPPRFLLDLDYYYV